MLSTEKLFVNSGSLHYSPVPSPSQDWLIEVRPSLLPNVKNVTKSAIWASALNYFIKLSFFVRKTFMSTLMLTFPVLSPIALLILPYRSVLVIIFLFKVCKIRFSSNHLCKKIKRRASELWKKKKERKSLTTVCWQHDSLCHSNLYKEVVFKTWQVFPFV